MFWKTGWVGRGEIKVARDTTVFRSAPASFRVEAVGNSLGQGSQTVSAKPGDSFRWSGYVKTDGVAKVNVAVQAFDHNWRPVAFNQACFVEGEKDWTAFSKDITVPPGARNLAFVLLVDGPGRAWLDDLRIAPIAE
jgi:hypothetical protein